MATRTIVVELRGGDLTVVVGCRGAARDLARITGFDPVDQTRIATAVSEVVRHAVRHGPGACLTLRQIELPGRRGVEVIVEDGIAGLPDLPGPPRGGDAASVSPDPGTSGLRQLVDELEVEPSAAGGARVRMRKWLAVRPVPGAAPSGAATGASGATVVLEPVRAAVAAGGVQEPGGGEGGPGDALAGRGGPGRADSDGLLAVQAGRLVFYPPSGSGRLPTLRPGAHVRVVVNGAPVERLRVVRPGDRIDVEVVHDEPAVQVRVEVSRDGLEATLHVERRPGTRYALVDRPPTSELTLVAIPEKTVPPPPLSREELMAALQAAGVVYGIDEVALRQVLTSTESGSWVVARGLPPVPSEDGRIELHFPDAPVLPADVPEEAERVDLLGLLRVSTVAPGTVLATRHPPRAGHPGRKVTGETIPVARPRDVPLRAGPGALPDEQGLRVYASRGGRPAYHRGAVAVLPLHVVEGDVGPETGHVIFDGDVVVTGSVNERMKVESGGRLVIGGIVSGAEIRAEDGVSVRGGLVRSRVVAGGMAAAALELASALRPVHRQLEQLVEAARAVRQEAARGGAASPAEGAIIRRVVDRKLPGLVRLVEELLRLSDQAQPLGVGDLGELASGIYRMLTVRSTREAVSIEKFAEHSRKVGDLLDLLAGWQAQPADVVARYIHNAEVQATGSVRVPSGSCHYARVRAGRGFVMGSGVFRGDEIRVQEGRVVLDEVGSPQGTKVWIAIETSGEVLARLVHPGVTVSIGGFRHEFTAGARGVRVRPTGDGPLEVLTAEGPQESPAR